MFHTGSAHRFLIERAFMLKCCLSFTYRRVLLCLVALILIFLFYVSYTSASSTLIDGQEDDAFSRISQQTSLPTLARVLYLFMCENQAEMDTYSTLFPSVTADVIFYCWHENCNSTHFRPSINLHVKPWSGRMKPDKQLISHRANPSSRSIHSRIFIINEKQLLQRKKYTWTTARNKLYEFALNQEQKQGWRWAYYAFADGDTHTACPLAEQLLTNKTVVDYGRNEESLFADQYRSFVNLSTIVDLEEKCFLLFDAFLLIMSPAIGTVSGTSGPMAFPGLLSQVVYHIDAVFNAIHRDALMFLLPYCPRYDVRSWWTSQAIFVYRSLCLFGHVLTFDGVHIVRQTHRMYPRTGDPWAIDDDMNLVPDYLLRFKDYMKQSRFVNPLVLHHYAGWNLRLVSETCRRHHTAMNIDSCLVHGARVYQWHWPSYSMIIRRKENERLNSSLFSLWCIFHCCVCSHSIARFTTIKVRLSSSSKRRERKQVHLKRVSFERGAEESAMIALYDEEVYFEERRSSGKRNSRQHWKWFREVSRKREGWRREDSLDECLKVYAPPSDRSLETVFDVFS